jgi:pectinesterase
MILKTKRRFLSHLIALCLIFMSVTYAQVDSEARKIFVQLPANNAININPDTHLELTFNDTPIIGDSGQIRIYDVTDNRLVDLLDISIPPGPTSPSTSPKPSYTPVPYEYISGHFTNANTKPGTPSGGAVPTPDKYQLTIIGGFTDGFHFYPIIIRDKKAIIYPHNNLLEYDKTYYVQIDPGVLILNDNSFTGITGNTGWCFTTKKQPPSADLERLVVSADGGGDFNTVQGAIDYIPDYNQKHIAVFIQNGIYEEIVYFRNKTNITILGEDRNKVIVQYANNEVFNPHPANISTNEVEGTFPSRRAAFAVDHSSRIHLVNFTIRTTSEKAQAEGLLLNGSENIIYNVTIRGSGDALQSNGSAYYTSCRIEGEGDMILGRGPAFFKNCELSTGGPYMWIRNTSANHGNVFVSCKFLTPEGKEAVFARAPINRNKTYPYSEAVLINCSLGGILPVGWGEIGGETSNIHYWEYNSTYISDGKPVDVSQRHTASKQLTWQNDSGIVANYSNPAFVFDGWVPEMAPLILTQPELVTVKEGQIAIFRVTVAAIHDACYQWLKNSKLIDGATDVILTIKKVGKNDAANYTVNIKNSSGSVTSQVVKLRVN